MSVASISELTAVVGELRHFAKSQAEMNGRILDKLDVISDRLAGMAEVGTELKEYRKTLHERFDRINEALASHTLEIMEFRTRTAVIETSGTAMDRRVLLMETIVNDHSKAMPTIWRAIAIAYGVALLAIGFQQLPSIVAKLFG